jgi:hypothetical protein
MVAYVARWLKEVEGDIARLTTSLAEEYLDRHALKVVFGP